MGRKILVTGVAGFIGSHLARSLVDRGDCVVGLDNFCDYYDPARKKKNIEGIRQAAGDFSLIEGDIRDRRLVDQIMSAHRFHGVAHLAAMAGVRASAEEPWLYYDVNLTGTLNLLDAAARQGRPNFVLASTSSAYGRTERIPFREDDPADRPLAPYPASKRSAELLGHSYHHLHGLDVTALRFFTVYGPAGRPDMMAYLVLESIRSQRPIPLYNGGHMYRDWTYVDDVVRGIESALEHRLGYEIINIGCGRPVYLRDFVSALERLSGKKAQLESAPMMAADVSYTFANIDKARRLLGYEPTVPFEEGTRRLYHWFTKNVGSLE